MRAWHRILTCFENPNSLLDPQAQALDQPKARAEHQLDDELVGARQGRDHRQGLLLGQDVGQSLGFLGPDGVDGTWVYFKYLVVQKEQGAEGVCFSRLNT